MNCNIVLNLVCVFIAAGIVCGARHVTAPYSLVATSHMSVIELRYQLVRRDIFCDYYVLINCYSSTVHLQELKLTRIKMERFHTAGAGVICSW